MMRLASTMLCGFVALCSQGVLRHIGVPDMLVPQLIVLLVIHLSFAEVTTFGCIMAFLLGLLVDVSSAVLLGPWAGSLVVLFGSLALLSQRLFIESGVAAACITFFSVVATNILFSLLGAEYPVVTWEYPQKVLGQALVTAMVAPVVLSALARRARRKNGAFVSRGSALTPV
jgi:rod shape-determining protein MreD